MRVTEEQMGLKWLGFKFLLARHKVVSQGTALSSYGNIILHLFYVIGFLSPYTPALLIQMLSRIGEVCSELVQIDLGPFNTPWLRCVELSYQSLRRSQHAIPAAVITGRESLP